MNVQEIREAESKSDRDIKRILWYCGCALFVGFVVVFLRPIVNKLAPNSLFPSRFTYFEATTSLLWALGVMGLGFLVGFLFGIPKVLQNTAQNVASEIQSTSPSVIPNVSSRLKVNTNLEEISDWLTKLLVGATLTQLVRLPDALKAFATFIAGTPYTSDQSFAASLIIYFSVTGFLSGYLVTRTYFTVVFGRADNPT